MDESNEVLAQRVTALEATVQALAENLLEAIRLINQLSGLMTNAS